MKRLTRDPEHLLTGEEGRIAGSPAMTIDPGETVVVETINHMTPIVRGESDLHPHSSPEYRERKETGRISVRGARPGMMLKVRIDSIEPVGFPHAKGSGSLKERFPQEPKLFPVEDGRVHLPGGISIPYSPSICEIYTTPDRPEHEWLDNGGCMAAKDICPGNTLYLPVFHEGGLLTLGDVHAAQGDAELYGEGAEMAAIVTITVDIDDRTRSGRPLLESREFLMSLGCRGTLWEAIGLVTTDMVDILSRLYGIEEKYAYLLATLSGSLRFMDCLNRVEATTRRSFIGLSVPKDFDLTRRVKGTEALHRRL